MAKIAFVAPPTLPVPPVLGGAIQTGIYLIAKALKDEYDITIFSLPTPEQESESIKYYPVHLGIFDSHILKLLKLPLVQNHSILRGPLKAMRANAYGFKCIPKFKQDYFDIIVVHNTPLFIPIFKKATPKSKLILYMQNYHLTKSKYLAFVKPIYKIALRYCKLLVSASYTLLNDILNHYPEISKKSLVIYNGVETEIFDRKPNIDPEQILADYGIKKKGITILFVGRLRKEKGIHILLESLIKIKNELEFNLIIAGSSEFKLNLPLTPYEKLIRDMSKKLNGRVIFLGHVERKALPYLYNASDVVVVPSIKGFEGNPYVLLEAMSCGKCVIASSDMAEIIEHGKDGLIFDPDEPSELALLIMKVAKDEHLRCKLGLNARATILKRFSTEYQVHKTKIVLEKLLSS